ncbi:MAG: YafY family transcriptional regulator [Nocardioidaceae bacterium]|nr:YafY family transcriptional regulator [Nocardioidaceae bacterium]NUS52983.1 YafY family transcriptional regulator [Nocardioidaceae bacterium]
MLQLLSLLQTHRYWPGGELARRLEVSERTLRRDVDRLRELGYPVHAVRGVAGGYQLQAGAAMPPLLLDDEEAVAIVVGLRAAAGGMVEGIDDTSVRALSKIVQVMPPRLRRRVDALRSYTVPAVFGSGGPTLDAGLLATLAQACRDDERLRFGYRTREGDEAERTVEPHTMVTVGRRWYLVAWDLTRHDWRSFRVDRMTDATATGVRFRPRELPGGDAAEYVKSGLRSAPQRHHVSVLVHADAESVRGRVGRWGEVTDTGDGSCRLTMEADDLGWPMFALMGIGAEFDVEEPAELVEEVDRVAGLFGRAVRRTS